MLEKVRNYIKNYQMLEKNDRIVMGVSGGADSVCLFTLLNMLKDEYGLRLFVVHINHGIRKTAAEEDAEYVKKLCEEAQIPFFLFKEDIPALAKKDRMTEEEAGRIYRYRCFYQVMEQVNADKLAVAHHMGDQAETVLFHLIRGSNLSGMTGIHPVNEVFGMEENRERGSGEKMLKVIRPLLQCRKEELIQFLKEKHMNWREDSTNADNIYTRNKLRNQVIPLLEEMNQQAVSHIADFAATMMEYEAFFRNTTDSYLKKWVMFEKKESRCQTNREMLQKQERILQTAVVYEMLVLVCGVRKDITKEHVEAVCSLLEKQSGKKITLPYKTVAEVSYENLIIRKDFGKKTLQEYRQEISLSSLKEKEDGIKLKLPYGGFLHIKILDLQKTGKDQWQQSSKDIMNLKNNYTKFFDCDTIRDTLCVRNWEKEDYFIINDAGNKKRISRYLIDNKIPAEERDRKIVVTGGHEVLWLIGGRRGENHKVSDDTRYVLFMMYGGANDEGSD